MLSFSWFKHDINVDAVFKLLFMGPWPLLAPVATPAAMLSLISLFVLSSMVWLCNVLFLFLLVFFWSIVGLVYKLSSLHCFIILINLYRFIQGKEKKKKKPWRKAQLVRPSVSSLIITSLNSLGTTYSRQSFAPIIVHVLIGYWVSPWISQHPRL